MKKINTNGMSPCLEYTAKESCNEYTSAAGESDNRCWTMSCVGSGRRSRSAPERSGAEAEGGGAWREGSATYVPQLGQAPGPPRCTETAAATKRQSSGDQRPHTTHIALPLRVPVGRHPGLCLLVTAPSAHHTAPRHTTPPPVPPGYPSPKRGPHVGPRPLAWASAAAGGPWWTRAGLCGQGHPHAGYLGSTPAGTARPPPLDGVGITTL